MRCLPAIYVQCQRLHVLDRTVDESTALLASCVLRYVAMHAYMNATSYQRQRVTVCNAQLNYECLPACFHKRILQLMDALL